MIECASRVVDVSAELVDRTLDCYFPGVRYLANVQVEYSVDGRPLQTELGPCQAIARGTFSGRPPWYIRDTGHFNAIEFNICYNQIAFVLLAQCAESEAVPALCRHLPKEEFFARMLPDIVIHRYAVRFDRPMAATSFRASVGIAKVIDRMQRLFLETHCRVAAPDGPWCSRGEVTLAVVRSGAHAKANAQNAVPTSAAEHAGF